MAEEIIEGVNPTRMELLKIKSKLRLAEKGHRLLKERRDALIMEFMNISKTSGEVVSDTINQSKTASTYLKYADSLAGPAAVDSAALAASDRDILVEVTQRNVVGVKVPDLSAPDLTRPPNERGFGIVSSHPILDKAALEHEKFLTKLIDMMQVESSLRSLSTETKRTKRRVNALEYSVIPKLKNTQKYIRMRLDELEREDFYRLKMFKGKRGD
ncbi:MAG: V-type ATP synthase subunit D [Candidatus Altiarchaeota archaeon]|nr:V-type ATP synthase subunit D [Candidatus Altiarchaeota archaeon]